MCEDFFFKFDNLSYKLFYTSGWEYFSKNMNCRCQDYALGVLNELRTV